MHIIYLVHMVLCVILKQVLACVMTLSILAMKSFD